MSDDKIPTLDCTINGVPVEFPQWFWEQVWKDVVHKMIEDDTKVDEEVKEDG